MGGRGFGAGRSSRDGWRDREPRAANLDLQACVKVSGCGIDASL